MWKLPSSPLGFCSPPRSRSDGSLPTLHFPKNNRSLKQAANFLSTQSVSPRRFSNVNLMPIEELPQPLRTQARRYFRQHRHSASALLKPQIGLAGKNWVASLENERHQRITGTGPSIGRALKAFDCEHASHRNFAAALSLARVLPTE